MSDKSTFLYEQRGASFGNVEVIDSHSSTFNIGNTTQNTYLQKPDFFEPSLEQFESPNFVSPSQGIIQKFFGFIQEKRILAFGGGNDIDKPSLARYFAWHISNRGYEKLPILEWQRSSDPQSIDVELQKAEETTIFLLNQVSPQNIGYDLSRIHKMAVSRQHYVIITTDIPIESWKLSPETTEFWQNLSGAELYDQNSLVKALVQALNNTTESLKQVLLNENIEPEDQCIGNLTVHTVAQQLQTPDKIARFVQLLAKEFDKNQELPQKTKVIELIKEIKNNETALNNWFYQILDSREQLLALGLNFFTGLLDDQFFAALEEIVENVWQKRDPSLRALDYCDLDNLRNFFNLNPINTETDRAKVEGCFPQQRRMLFKVAWSSHRRQILAALATIETLVQNSVANRSFEQELYGTSARCEQIRLVLGEALSDIGWISPTAIQDTLRHLAADEELEVQAVAAYAMARWRDPNYNREQELFETLHNWQNDQRLISQLKSILTNQDEKTTKEPQDYIRATIALTVSYAALYDPPNQLHPKLYDLLKKLSEDPNNLVRDRFGYHTLPRVASLHLVQLRDMLHDLTLKLDLIPAISRSLAFTYQLNPEEVLRTLELWISECSTSRSINFTGIKITRYNCLLGTVALTYGQIRYDEGINPFTPDQGFHRLRNILQRERYSFIRQVVLIAIKLLTIRYFEQIEDLLQDLVAEVKSNERKEIVYILGETYLKQRENLSNGDDEIEINGHRYSIWRDLNQRPRTAVEEAMFRWLKDNSKPVAQQVAEDTEVKFYEVLDQEEEKKIQEIQDRQSKQELYSRESWVDPVIVSQSKSGFYLNKLVPWLATKNAERYRPAISNLLPKAFWHYQLRRDMMTFVLRKWSHVSDNEVKTISSLLKSALRWAAILPWLLAVGGGSLLMLIIVVATTIKSNLSEPDIVQAPTSPEQPNNSRKPSENLPVNPGQIENPFYKESFPKAVCGDPLPKDPNVYPVNFYPVYIDYSENSLIKVTSSFCQDARKKTREETDNLSIQVASFATIDRAEAFKDFMIDNFGSGEIGEPTQIESPK
ncbi:HEAT repeat domain-containing protein [Coleofasciculus sp. F4-SAH-05]|uniref:HEAT repeat domain-containing protein n=1 Tax=Coleofasciculus sp. F4-SAH-05 TaxID=3069525 RepID=UPI0032F64ECD